MDVRITIKGHRFEPDKIEVPAGRRLKLVVTNADATPEEFECKVLRIERVILGGQSATFNVRPLNKGQTYKFFGEMTMGEIAEVLEISERTALRDWKKARTMLSAALGA